MPPDVDEEDEDGIDRLLHAYGIELPEVEGDGDDLPPSVDDWDNTEGWG